MTEPYQLWRQDDNGNEFLIDAFEIRNEAEEKLAEFEAKGHKQTYWIVEAKPKLEPHDVTVVTSTVENIRARPHMWFGATNEDGLYHILCEVVSNGIDQYLAGKATEISVEVEGLWFRVSDNGAYFCRKKARNHLTEFQNLPTADNHAPHIHLGAGGLGLFPVNCVCSSFCVESEDDEGGWRLTFREGRFVSEESVERPGLTSITAVADAGIFNSFGIPSQRLRRTLFEGVHLFPGLAVSFQEERFFSKDGLVDLATFDASTVLDFFTTSESCGKFGYNFEGGEVSFTFSGYGNAETCRFISWVNGARTVLGGSHLDGVKDVLHELGWTPTVAMIHVIMKKPQFAGPTKGKLRAEKVREIVRDTLSTPLKRYVEALNINESGDYL